MKENTIYLNESEDILKFKIVTKEGKATGDYITFDAEDIELLDRLQKMNHDFKSNYTWVHNELAIIEKKQDFMGKNDIMTNNQKLQYHTLKEFYKRQRKTFELFLGEDGVEKLLYGRAFEWSTMEEIQKLINEQMAPKIKINMDNIKSKIKKRYNVKEEIEVLE